MIEDSDTPAPKKEPLPEPEDLIAYGSMFTLVERSTLFFQANS